VLKNQKNNMPRRKYKKREILPDPIFNNVKVSKFINYIMRKGKKGKARKIIFDAFGILKEKTKKDPLEIFELAIRNTSPLLEVRPKRIGGATYQVPMEVKPERKLTLAMRWILEAAKSKKGRPMKERLASELLEAAQGKGTAVKKKENAHRMAEANKAFAHFAF